MGEKEELEFAAFQVGYTRLLEEEASLSGYEGRLLPMIIEAITSKESLNLRAIKLPGTIDHLIGKITELAEGYVSLEERIPRDNAVLRRLVNYHAKRSLHYAIALADMKKALNPEARAEE